MLNELQFCELHNGLFSCRQISEMFGQKSPYPKMLADTLHPGRYGVVFDAGSSVCHQNVCCRTG